MKLFISILLVFGSFSLFGANNFEANSSSRPAPPSVDDSMFFDLNNSVVTTSGGSSYIDIPMIINAQYQPYSFDFWFRFNEAKMTFFSTTSLFSQIETSTNFNTLNHFLQSTSSGPSILYQVPTNTTLVMIRFLINDPCVEILPSDFYEVNSLLDGIVCKNEMLLNTSLSPSSTSDTTLCTNTSVDFNFPSLMFGKTITNWNWDFANGVSGYTQNPTASFTDPGNYPVTIDITTVGGCTYSFIQNVVIYNRPTANFSYINDVVQDSVFFLNIIPQSDDTLTFMWNFGDTQTSAIQDPAHHYISGGNYSVSLLSTTNHGCSSSYIQSIIIDKPTANFSHTGSCSGSIISFVDNSIYSTGTISSWNWNFGDGTTSTQQNPSHIFTFAGAYNVTLVVTGSTGASGTYSTVVQVSSKPLVQFVADLQNGCSPLLVNFNDLSIAANGSTYLWNFGDNLTSNSQNPSHTYLVGGVFPVKLIVTTLTGCSDSLIKPSYINVTTAATANFSTTEGCSNALINFIDNSTIASGSIISWSWDFGDGFYSSSQNPTHIYSTSGNYTATLTAINDLGCTGSITKNIIINNKPTLQFTSSDLLGCAPLNSNFQNLSTFAIGSEFLWDFGDGFNSTAQNPTHIFLTEGNYDVSLLITAPGGCADSLTMNAYIDVFNAVQANFVTSNRCANSPTVFTDISTITNGSIVSWNWSFGNGNSSTTQNPNFDYIIPGNYTAILTVQTDQGCSNSISQNLTIDAQPVVNFSVNDSLGCGDLSAQFIDLSTTSLNSTYLWNFGDNTTSTVTNPIHNFTLNGSYTIKEIVTTPQGCADSLIKTNYISMQTPPTSGLIASSNSAIMPQSIINFTSQSLNYSNLLWDFGDSNFSTLEDPSHNFLDTGNFSVCLIAFSSFGCADTTCIDISITNSNAIAVPTAFSPNGDNNNDVFLIEGGPFLEIEMKIFNEWGNQLFSSSVQSVGWNGKFNDVVQPIGVYEYIITGKTLSNDTINLYGVVNLTR